MKLHCIICTKEAFYLYKGTSLCSLHRSELFSVASGDVFGGVLDAIIAKHEKKTSMPAMPKVPKYK